MYEADLDHADANRLTKFADDYPEETASCYNNLNKVLELLNGGISLQSIGVNFFRSEGGGLYAVGQKRTEKSLETRLYVAFNQYEKKYYLLGIGDKDSQKKDVKKYQKVITNEQILKEGNHEAEQTERRKEHDDR